MQSYGGLLLHREIDALHTAIHHPERPCTIILGGAKVADKIGVMKYFWKKADHFLLGGGPANTFCAARGMDVRNSLIDKKVIPEIKKFLHSSKIEIPLDFRFVEGKILDIGEKTAQEYQTILENSTTIIWNGPMGFFEKQEFVNGTHAVWKGIRACAEKNKKAKIVVGGGETVASFHALFSEKTKLPQNIFLSTGGGAMLDYLSGKKLPGIEALKQK